MEKKARVRKETLARCIHGNQAFRCTKCGYLRAMCPHGRQPSKCKVCTPTAKKPTKLHKKKPPPRCEHGVIKYNCKQCWHSPPRCEHGVIKYNCTSCGRRTRKCEHGKLQYSCTECKRMYRVWRSIPVQAKEPNATNDEDEINCDDLWVEAPRDLDDLEDAEELLVLDD